jgi:hypothetical protein
MWLMVLFTDSYNPLGIEMRIGQGFLTPVNRLIYLRQRICKQVNTYEFRRSVKNAE